LDSKTADLVARSLIAKVCKIREGPEYDQAVLAGAIYWQSVMTGRPHPAAKQLFDSTMSTLTGQNVTVQLKRKSRTETLKRALYDTFTMEGRRGRESPGVYAGDESRPALTLQN
jgi:hypothetical protein